MKFHLEKKDETIDKIVKATYPDYSGRTIKISTKIPDHLESYWTGGSRDYYAFYELSTGKSLSVHSNHPGFEPNQPRKLDKLPDGLLLVKHSIFCGKDMGITIYSNPENMTPLLPKPGNELSDQEITVLQYTSVYLNTYAGEKNVRFKYAHNETGISLDDWNNAKSSLLEKKLLSKSWAIMPAGRNYLSMHDLDGQDRMWKRRGIFKPSLPFSQG